MKKLLLALTLFLSYQTNALAQCNGVFPANTICGNHTGANALPVPVPSSVLTGIPGGSPGQVQFNNAGAFGGLTPTQLTALINPATASLSGALPAWPNTATTFFSGLGTYVVPPTFSSGAPGYVPASGGSSTSLFLNQAGGFTTASTATNYQPVFNITSSPYNAKCDYAIAFTATMGIGTPNVITPAPQFQAGDVGKYIIVKGAGSGGNVLISTILTFVNSQNVALAANAVTGVSNVEIEYGSDDASAINAAVAAAVAASGGTIYIPANKSCMVSQINLTGIGVALTIRGEGVSSSRLMPLQNAASLTGHGHVIDLTGSSQLTLDNFEIGTFQTLAVAPTAIFLGQIAGNSSNRLRFRNLYVTGQYTGATFYDFGVPSYEIFASDFYNYLPGAGSHGVMYLTATNAFSYSSSFATVVGGTMNTSDIHCFNCELHKFGGTGADNWVLRLDTTTNIAFYGGVINGGATAYVFTDGACAHLSFFNTTFENEGPATVTVPTNAFIKVSGTVTDLNDPGSSYGNSGAKFSPASTTTNLVTNAQ